MNWLKKSFIWLLNTLFPGNELEEEIRSMSLSDITQKITPKGSDNITSLLNYRDPIVRKMVWMLKYHGDRHVSKLFAGILDDYLLEELSDIEVFDKVEVILMPIPLSRARIHARGFNQIELVLKNLKNDYKIDAKSLIKSRNTKPQTEIRKKEERIKNVVGAYSISNPEEIKNKHIILIDDVATTGSTLKEAKKALLENGAKNIECLAFAH
ncbi:MAG: phosphoribosyltransferase family protein [Candidatus Pacebacteria bacterium]|jgi:ComF family protein|nr:phosphoribosyltransferase family protein [Candidatus Paceibacterota bacterium]MDP6659452.1 phosphoribosyltransferase family protein [Candidatus Paceibacterota bacterium]|tara:strand:+ start:15897 stop:16529 length:633 start_codon:yes stop_codon:yes gene_type:complete